MITYQLEKVPFIEEKKCVGVSLENGPFFISEKKMALSLYLKRVKQQKEGIYFKYNLIWRGFPVST